MHVVSNDVCARIKFVTTVARVATMTEIRFYTTVPAGDPAERPCTIVGKKSNLSVVSFASVAPYLGNKITEDVSTL